MGVLGYPRFGAAGGDIGSGVSRYLGLDHPGRAAAQRRGWQVWHTQAGLEPGGWVRRTAAPPGAGKQAAPGSVDLGTGLADVRGAG